MQEKLTLVPHIFTRCSAHPLRIPCARASAAFRLKFPANPLKLAPMSKDQDSKKQASKNARKLKSEAKQQQLSEALRANLRRRKEQTRERKKGAQD